MNMEAIIDERTKLEIKLYELLKDFEKMSKCEIFEVRLIKRTTNWKENEITGIQIDVRF